MENKFLNSTNKSSLLSFAFLFIFLIPIIFILMKGQPSLTLPNELIEVMIFTLWQALVSSALATALGFLAAIGLSTFPSRKIFSDTVLLLPNFLPNIVVILSSMSLFHFFGIYLKGSFAIIFIHVFLNVGFVAVWLKQKIFEKAIVQLSLVFIEGAKWSQWWPQLYRILKNDISSAFFFVFYISFFSFSVPLIVGDSGSSTIEVLIYEKIKIEQNWPQATTIVYLQLVLLMFLSLFLRKRSRLKMEKVFFVTKLWNFPYLRAIAYLPLFLIALGFFIETVSGMTLIHKLNSSWSQIFKAFSWSLVIAFLTSILTFITFTILIFIKPQKFLLRFLFGIGTPSAVIIAYAFVGNGTYSSLWVPVTLIATATTYLYFPSLFRVAFIDSYQETFFPQKVAELLGASHLNIFLSVTLPMLLPKIVLAAQIVGFWSLGEFAMSSIFTDESFHLGLMTKDFLESYYLGLAMVLIWLLVALGIINFYALKGVSNVISYWLDKRLR